MKAESLVAAQNGGSAADYQGPIGVADPIMAVH
jgi:hypothetical protein